MAAKLAEEPKIHHLEENNELRFEVDSSGTATLELLKGCAEIFGTELVSSRKYSIPPSTKAAVYTFHGCSIKLEGRFESDYIAKQTPMITYVNLHGALEQLRDQAAKNTENSRGPRVMITGQSDVGKSTLCRILVNYAVRQERIPVYVDVDVGQGDISIPGTISALIVQRPHDIEEGYPQSTALVYHYGHKSPGENIVLYNQLVSTLAQTINKRCELNANANIGGCIINTCGWIKGGGYKSLLHIAGAFEVDIIVVIDQERLLTELKRDMPDFVKVIHLPKSGGVVERSREARIQTRDNKVRSYFYGPKSGLIPHSFYVNFSDVKIFKIGAPELPDSLLPLGMVMQQGQTKLMPMVPSEALKHHVLSVSACEDSESEETIINTPTAGFIVITEVDMEKKWFRVLAPVPDRLPRNVLIDSDITFMDIK